MEVVSTANREASDSDSDDESEEKKKRSSKTASTSASTPVRGFKALLAKETVLVKVDDMPGDETAWWRCMFQRCVQSKQISASFFKTKQNDFLDILPIRSKIDGSMQFGELVQKLEIDLAKANSNNQISVDQLISSLGIQNKKDLSILFPVIFDYQKNNNYLYVKSRT